MKRKAYPQTFKYEKLVKQPNLKNWNDLARQINITARAYPDIGFKEILYKFTKDWEYSDRAKFKRWYSWMYQGQKNKEYRTKSGDLRMKKLFALDFTSDKQREYEGLKSKLQSRINSAEKLLDKLLNKKLIDLNSGRKMGRIMHMLKEEIRVLQSVDIIQARMDRAIKILRKGNFSEGAIILKGGTIKKAQGTPDETQNIMNKIKDVINSLNYNKYLDDIYSIKRDLERMGRLGEAETVTRVIREDLSGLEKPSKRLSEVYTSLARTPKALTEKEDKKLENEKPKEIVVEEEPKQSIQQPEKLVEEKPEPKITLPQPEKKERIPNI